MHKHLVQYPDYSHYHLGAIITSWAVFFFHPVIPGEGFTAVHSPDKDGDKEEI